MSLLVNGEYVDDTAIRDEASLIRPRLAEEMEGEDPIVLEMRVREWARENVIERVLLRQAALADPEPVDPLALDEAVRELRAQPPGQSGCTIATSDEEIRRDLETRIRVDRLIVKLTAKLAAPKNKDVTGYYKKNQSRFVTPELVHAAHIVQNVDEQTDEATALAAIETVQAKLRDGGNFEQLADEFSDCPGRGGDLGFFERGQMVEEFENIAFSIPAGHTSEIFRSPFGFHIAKVYERKPAGVRSLPEVRSNIEQALSEQKRERAIEQFLDDLRAKAEIKNAPAVASPA